MANPLLGLASGVAESAATGLINKGFSDSSNKEMMRRQHAYNKEQMKLQYAYNQQAQKNSASNLVQGLKMAGLSPALAAQGNFAAAPSVTASGMPSATPHNYASPVTGVQNFLEMAQAKLTQAQVENVEANTKSVEIKNQQELDANETASSLAATMFEKLADKAHSPDEQKTYLSLAQTARTKGSFALVSQLIDNLDKRELYNMHYQQYALGERVAWLQLNQDDVLTKIANMPAQEFEHLSSSVRYYTEYAEKLKADKNLTDKDRELRLEQIKLTKQQTQNLIAATKRINDTNLMKIAEDVGNGKAPVSKLLAACAFLLLGNVSTHF